MGESTTVFRGGLAMSAYYASAALLWLLITVLTFSLAVLLIAPGGEFSVWERVVSGAVLLLLATPLAMQARSLHSRMREMSANFVALDEEGVRVRLAGDCRASKGLPEFQDTRLRWSEISSVTCERRKFICQSLVPFRYPLDVYTIGTGAAAIPFTRECIPSARQAARAIATRLGQEVLGR
jgi:hypothetical protein